MFEHEVVVAAGGPVGCWLAGELRLAGVDVVVLEKRANLIVRSIGRPSSSP